MRRHAAGPLPIQLGGGVSDANHHNHESLPILLAGRGGKVVECGRVVRTPKETPLCKLYLSMLDRTGCPQETLADSTGLLTL